MSEKNSDLLKGLFIGGLIGVVLGILFAPKSGKETREDIIRKTDELLDQAKEGYEKAVEKSKTVYETAVKHLKDLEISAKEKMDEAESQVNEFAQQGAEAVEGNKYRLRKAIDAGLEAYREENTKKAI
ncbi:MAG: YtxH domain-containing protein [Deltaproteobacteria bacterium]|nr:YtxH domain-containing protein [Deltaproteobacteria bacterium]